MSLQIYAHRGYSAVAPENTMAAFQKAIEVGAHGVELDVHLTKDDQIVVIHDETVGRTTDGKGCVQELTLEELRCLDAGSWFGKDFKGEKIPLLSEVVKLVAEQGIFLNVELKNNKIAYVNLESKVIALLKEFDLVERTVISSFDHYSLRKVKELCPDLDTAILYMANLFEPWGYACKMGVTSIHPYWPTVSETIMTHCREYQLPVRPFTINQVKEMRRLIGLGVDALITDKVEHALTELKQGE